MSGGFKARRVLVDFDGVIKRKGSFKRPPVEGALQALKDMKSLGYEVVVFTSRANHDHGQSKVAQWLEDHGVQVDKVTASKLEADYYFDDRCVRIDEQQGWGDAADHVERANA